MISFATSADKSNGLYPRSSTSSVDQGVWSSSAPLESPYLVDRSGANYLPKCDAGTSSVPPHRPRPRASPGAPTALHPPRSRAGVRNSRRREESGNRRDREVVRGNPPDRQFTPSSPTAASLPVPRSARKP